MESLVSLSDIEEAYRSIRSRVRRTPVVEFMHSTGEPALLLKLENTQLLGSFKIRGSLNSLIRLPERARHAGVVAFSSGNHGLAVAHAGKELGLAVTVVMPVTAPDVKIAAVRSAGATVELVELARRAERCAEIVDATGAAFVHPFDSVDAICGHGGIGLELVEQVPRLRMVLVPVSGGGLISGVAAAVKATSPDVTVIGVEPELAGDAAESLRAGDLRSWPAADTNRTCADGLVATSLGALPWQHVRALVDDIVTVTEAEIHDAMRALVLSAKQVVEPSGAVTTAAVLSDRVALPTDGSAVALVSGGNVAPTVLADVLTGR